MPHLLTVSSAHALPFGAASTSSAGPGRSPTRSSADGRLQSDRQLPQRSAVHADGLARRGQHRRRRISVPIASAPARLANPTIDAWFDKTAFVDAGRVHVRQLRREASSAADHQWNVDASLFKRLCRGNGSSEDRVPGGGVQSPEHGRISPSRTRRSIRRRAGRVTATSR